MMIFKKYKYLKEENERLKEENLLLRAGVYESAWVKDTLHVVPLFSRITDHTNSSEVPKYRLANMIARQMINEGFVKIQIQKNLEGEYEEYTVYTASVNVLRMEER